MNDNKDFKKEDIWIPPFYNDYDCYIKSSNNVMLFSICTSNKTLIKNIITKLNGESIEFKYKFKKSNDDFQLIQYNDKNVLLMRGWGHLTGCGALNLPEKEAAIIQDEMEDWVIETLNKVKLTKNKFYKKVHEIISDYYEEINDCIVKNAGEDHEWGGDIDAVAKRLKGEVLDKLHTLVEEYKDVIGEEQYKWHTEKLFEARNKI